MTSDYRRRSTLVPLPPAEDDPTSLGSILVKMGAITNQQLNDALEFKRNSDEGTSLGKILVATNTCSQSEVDDALRTQEGLRSKQVGEHARAVCDLAVKMKQYRTVEHNHIIRSGAALAAKLSSFPFVGGAITLVLKKL